MLLKISMETITFAIVLSSSEVSLHIWYRREPVCLFHVLRWVCPDSRYGWRLNVLPMFWLWTVQVERFSPFCLFCLEYGYDNNRKYQYNSSQMNHIGIIANQNMIWAIREYLANYDNSKLNINYSIPSSITSYGYAKCSISYTSKSVWQYYRFYFWNH